MDDCQGPVHFIISQTLFYCFIAYWGEYMWLAFYGTLWFKKCSLAQLKFVSETPSLVWCNLSLFKGKFHI